MMDYNDFLKSKTILHQLCGIKPNEPHSILFPFQRDIVKWALRLGRACIFADCGMGKTFMQLEWARQIPGDVIILAPLAVSQQTILEGEKLGVEVNYCRHDSDCKPGITITNYEMLDHFDPERFIGVVLDESSIIKHFEGKIRTQILNRFSSTQFRLACTATPAPNDFMELGNHAEFVGSMTRAEMLSMFFVHDGGETSKWRLKGHAEKDFWKWICSWAVMLSMPSDLGYENAGFILPDLTVKQITVESPNNGGFLFPMEASTLRERLVARKDSINERVSRCAELINNSAERWVIWCNLNAEADLLESLIVESIQVKGSEPLESKINKLHAFTNGEIRVMISKPSIAGHGLNWQHCHNVAFVGLSDSWESYYQAVRRCWRFGQKNPVIVFLVVSQTEGRVVANIKRKEADAMKMKVEMINNMHSLNVENIRGTAQLTDLYCEQVHRGANWTIYQGDCVEVLKRIESDSIGYSIFSPPFASLYTYSASERDMGNTKNHSEFYQHFKFAVQELYRVLQPGRNLSFHCMNLPTSKTRDGFIGIVDFRGELIRIFIEAGFIYHSEVCIWKDPVTAMQRTKALGLLWKQLKKDSSMSRQGIADYLVTMRKPGENAKPVNHTAEEFPVQQWQKWASPIWMDINPSDTLQYRSAREHQDERHICPLQLEVIRRGLVLWSKPGDLVLSPFAGIGSEGWEAVRANRRFVGIELKTSYYNQAVANLALAEKSENLLVGI